jgi:SAM-dependent methyltransferase
MRLCVESYLRTDQHYRVVDLGSRVPDSQSKTHRDLFDGYDCGFTGVDVRPGRNVDAVMRKPYRIPVKSNSADVLVTGQAFEHIPFFWASILEIARVLAPRGLVFLTAPSRGHVHDLMDCWRYYPDGMRALAAFSRLKLLETHTDLPPTGGKGQRFDYTAIDSKGAYWGDTVGVFQKPVSYSKLVTLARVPLVWWCNRVGGIEHVPAPKPKRGRREVTAPSGALR